jgi:hypothetical protein
MSDCLDVVILRISAPNIMFFGEETFFAWKYAGVSTHRFGLVG